MAEPVFLSNMAIWLGGYDHSAEENSCNFSVANAEEPDATFGDVLEAKYPGLLIPSVDLAGRWSAGALSPDATYFPRVSSDVTAWPLTMCPPAAPAATPGADGNLAYTVIGAQFAYEAMVGEHGKLLGFKLKTLPRSTGTVNRGTVMLPKAQVAATTTGTARQLGALSASQRMIVTLHAFAINGGSWVLTVESDNAVGFPTPAVRATLTAVTSAPNRLTTEIAGPVTDDYWRVVLTKTGGTSITPAATLGIVPIA
jgi:hypothetical protein